MDVWHALRRTKMQKRFWRENCRKETTWKTLAYMNTNMKDINTNIRNINTNIKDISISIRNISTKFKNIYPRCVLNNKTTTQTNKTKQNILFRYQFNNVFRSLKP